MDRVHLNEDDIDLESLKDVFSYNIDIDKTDEAYIAFESDDCWIHAVDEPTIMRVENIKHIVSILKRSDLQRRALQYL